MHAEPFFAPFSFNYLDISRVCTCHTLQTGSHVHTSKLISLRLIIKRWRPSSDDNEIDNEINVKFM